MAQQHTALVPNRKTSKTLTWKQQEALEEAKRTFKGHVHSKRARITEAMESRGLTYRDR